MQLLKRGSWLAILVPAAVGVVLRLLLVGGPPFTDGGTYQYNAVLAHEVAGSLPTAPINFYSWLAGLLGHDADAPFLRARVLDAIACGAAAGAFGWLLTSFARWRVASVLASLWAVSASSPVFADAGFKNPIVAASLPLFLATGMIVRRGDRGALRAGMLVALACLLREGFAPAALLMPLVALCARGPRAAVRCVIGGMVGGAAGLAWMVAAGIEPGEALANLRAMSRNASALLAAIDADPGQLRVDNLWRALEHAWFLVLPSALGAALVLRRIRGRSRARLAAVAALLVVPLPEIFGKFCLAYHWAQLLPGMLLLGALGDRRLQACARAVRRWRFGRAVAWLTILTGVVFGSAALRRDVHGGMLMHGQYRSVMIDGDWSTPAASRGSRYLQMALWLRENTAVDARVLASGYGYAIYPLSGRSPASVEVSDLTFSRMTGQPEHHPEWLEALRAAPPDIVIETLRWREPLTGFWPDFEQLYELAVEWHDDPSVHYGSFAARLWRLRD